MSYGTRRHDTKIAQATMDISLQSALYTVRMRLSSARGHRKQEEIARALGVSSATISNIETGEANVSLQLVREYIEYLGIPRGEEILAVYTAINGYLT